MLDFSFAAVICVIEDMEKIREEFKGEEATKGRFTFGQVFDYINDGCYPEGLDKKEKLSLRKGAKYFVIRDAQLFYVGGRVARV